MKVKFFWYFVLIFSPIPLLTDNYFRFSIDLLSIILIVFFLFKKKVCVFLVCHAEMNAIMNKNSADVKGCTMYVALFPCNECAKLIIQSGEDTTQTHTHTPALPIYKAVTWFNCLFSHAHSALS